jgi:hypothetical protein
MGEVAEQSKTLNGKKNHSKKERKRKRKTELKTCTH